MATGIIENINGRLPAYGMGKNLLDNWYFLNPVNQRGVTSGSGAEGYSIDRWKASFGSGGVLWSLTSSGLTFQPTNTNSYAYISQVIDNEILSALTGKRICVYVLTSDGDMLGGIVTYTSEVPIYDANYDGHRVRIRFSGGQFRIESFASALTVRAVKLELGTEQTLCHNEGTAEAPVWVLNEIPDYEYELFRCMTSTADPSDTYANKTLATGQELAYVENGTTASRAYAVGEYFCWHGLLYRAKTAIGNGDTFTVNTNCEQVPEGGLNNLIQVVYGSQAPVSVPNNTTTVIDSISLAPGTYLIMGSTSIDASSNTNMSLTIVGSGGVGSLAASRGTADAGGGLIACVVVTIEASTTFTLRLRHSAGDNVSTVGNRFCAIQLK